MTSPAIVPHDLVAERAVLGAILLDRDSILVIADLVQPDDFYLHRHAEVYAAALACVRRREPPDTVTIGAELRRRGTFEEVGGLAFLSELVMEVPTSVHIEYYARHVVRTAMLRRVIEAGGRIVALGYNTAATVEPDEVMTMAEAELHQAWRGKQRVPGVLLRESLGDLVDHLQAMEGGTSVMLGIPTGYADLDRITGGLHPSDLIVLGGRPGHGKTALALALAYQMARLHGYGVGIFSLEMRAEEVTQRLAAMHAAIPLRFLRSGGLRGDLLTRTLDAMGELADFPIVIDDTCGMSLGTLRARALRMRSEYDIRMLIIDYLQLMSSGVRTENRVQEITAITSGLKALARDLNCPVVALAQLSRRVDERPGHVPLLSDFRESGSIEQDSDLVIAIQREESYNPQTSRRGVLDLHILKHRNGPLGVVALRFDAPTMRLEPLATPGAKDGAVSLGAGGGGGLGWFAGGCAGHVPSG